MAHKTPFARREYMKRWTKSNRHRTALYHRNLYERNRRFVRDLKEGMKCATCPESHRACLDFHHISVDSKDEGIADLVGGHASKQRILAEIAKCIVLCANCHRKLHSEEKTGQYAGQFTLMDVKRSEAIKAGLKKRTPR